VERLGAAVAGASGRSIPWTFYLVADAEPNAFTVGEGYVFVTDGLLRLKLTDDELAGVLAHEVAHGMLRHSERGSDQEREVARAMQELEEAQALADRYEDEYRRESGDPNALDRYRSKIVTARRRVEQARARLKSVGYQLEHEQEYSHADEIDADLKGLEVTARAGYDPEGLARALLKLQQYGVQKFGEAALQGGRTHPPIARRVEILQRVYANWRSRR
ncbi:MAG: M48 family metallopeptidase, partial [Candidatus Eremiobacterota bacterium]